MALQETNIYCKPTTIEHKVCDKGHIIIILFSPLGHIALNTSFLFLSLGDTKN